MLTFPEAGPRFSEPEVAYLEKLGLPYVAPGTCVDVLDGLPQT